MAEAAHFEWIVDDVGAGERLDKFVLDRLTQQDFPPAAPPLTTRSVTRSAVRRWIDAGRVSVNQQSVKAGQGLKRGDRVEVSIPPPEPSVLTPQDIPLKIVYEDQRLIVIDKPAGLVVHPGAGNRQGTLANALLHHLNRVSRPESVRPGIVHRLDKGTSGLIVIAKDEAAHEALAAQFKSRQVDKRYLALVYGIPDPPEGRIEAAIGRHRTQRTKMSTRSPKSRPALTEYKVLRTFPFFSLLEARLHTGRTHQIRVHFEHIGHPVVGDSAYSGNRPGELRGSDRAAIAALDRPFLHAWKLSFRHPDRKQALELEAPLPPELEEVLARLE